MPLAVVGHLAVAEAVEAVLSPSSGLPERSQNQKRQLEKTFIVLARTLGTGL